MVWISIEGLGELLGREPQPVIVDACSAMARRLDPGASPQRSGWAWMRRRSSLQAARLIAGSWSIAV
jgi:hypothetical protein